ncbi:forkhead box protein N1 isoform X2 [Phycodurus eques]|uniref:forkhead box protein N1 isoform X2 n=1 Tax=Phycodurus eques TaxID=693459 RepID=UPI002ACDE8F8|nr:forkhead box protein N1 isoform X2 [Phycodurus eques]
MDVCYERSTAWCRMSDCPTFSPSKDESQPLTTRAKPHTSHETLGTSCQQVAESQKTDGGDVCFTHQARPNLTSRHAHVSRRHSADGTGRQGPVDTSRFHPYLRQLSEGAVTNAVCLQRGSSPFSSLQEVCNPQMCCLTFGSSSESQTLWEQYDYNDQCSYSNLPAVSDETFCSHSQHYLCSTSASPPQEVTTRPYTTEEHSNEPNYYFQSLSSQINQRNNSQPLFPKPIYSYSILIFMALKNSETGSLPVSEIYSFMTENFPYFKTAPDGWKNSVRHNLSLNKSFEKLEGKNGNSSRKGCLWALNPAKVEKMQAELHKWRRKDPISVRRSMARPDDLDLLLGQMPKKLRSVPPYTRPASIYGTMPTSFSPTRGQPPSRASRRPQHSCAPSPSQQSCLLSLTDSHLSDSLALRAPCSQRHTADIHPGNLNLIATGKVPLSYHVTHQDDFSADLRSLQDSQSEGDTYDVDVLNPSLTDLQLKGNLWEELQEDSLGSHLRSAPTPMCITSRGLAATLCPTQLCRYHSARQSDLNGSCSGSL